MAEANRSDPSPNPGTPEEALTPDEQRPLSVDVEAAIERQFGDDPDEADDASGGDA